MIDHEIARVIAQGSKKELCFTGAIAGDSLNFQFGDVFTIPKDYVVFSDCIGSVRNEFTLVETEDGNVRKLYPSQLSRRVRVVNESMTLLGTVYANGTASQLYKMHATVSDGINALVGKRIVVSKVDRVTTMLPFSDRLTTKSVYTFDLV